MPFANHRLLLLAAADQRPQLIARLDRDHWTIVEAGDVAQARFLLQMQACDVLLACSRQPMGEEGLAWLLGAAPLVLACPAGEEAVEVVRRGALWLPDDAATCAPLLDAVLQQAVRQAEQEQKWAAGRTALRDAQARNDRLLGLLWEAAVGEGPERWLSQRRMLERLDEEVARSRRHGGPLSVVLAELHPPHGERFAPEQAHRLGRWLSDRITRGKRRSDVAGQYGLNGFMLLLPQTGRTEALQACQRLQRLLVEQPPDLPLVEARFGLASIPDDQASVQSLLCRAEERLVEEPLATA